MKLLVFATVVLVLALLQGCAAPQLGPRISTSHLTLGESEHTHLGQAVTPLVKLHSSSSGVYLLSDPHTAFAARALLAASAEQTLDVQYYIWRRDVTGTLLLHALTLAAERGVRVRLLLDDNGVGGLDSTLAAVNSHSNIEVRLFNPFPLRFPKLLGYLTDFSRVNHRMHNKAFISDNQASIVGGRNIADEYFGAGNNLLFSDLDVMAVGPVVQKTSADFDRYWASPGAYPLEQLLNRPADNALAAFQREATLAQSKPDAQVYIQATRESGIVQHLLNNNLDLEWAPVQLVSDDPIKVTGQAEKNMLISHQLTQILGAPSTSVILITPYFIPTKAGTELFTDMARRGIRIRVLTNSLAATDVAAVHAGYAKYRKQLLQAGIELFEMRPTLGNDRNQRLDGPFGSSSSSLHAKTFAVDGKRLFVGSFNFDPRSMNLNTEMGYVINSPELATQMETAIEERVRDYAYQVKLDLKGNLYWVEFSDSGKQFFVTEPDTGWFKRASVTFFSWLPIEALL
ncbi:MAG TPA: phospholipase D family protein [Marinobacter sp.]|nr:phospholipase D family protein [Marinobacter sp.]